jgi:hypothetical protein
MMKAASREFKNPFIGSPLTKKSAIIMVHAFTMKLKRLKVIRFKGKVNNSSNGLMNRFTINKTRPIINSAGILLIMILSITIERRYMVTTIDKYLSRSFDIVTSYGII